MNPRKKAVPSVIREHPEVVPEVHPVIAPEVPSEPAPRTTGLAQRLAKRVSLRMMIPAALIILAGAGGGVYLSMRPQDAQTPQEATQKEVDLYVGLVGKLMLLPADEVPLIATVADPAKLQGQAFFENAKKGDKVLLYNVARKAILYDPVANKIINVAPLSPGTQPSVAPTP